jgi:hypothetical protein
VRLALTFTLLALPAAAQEMTDPPRDPASVPLPAGVEMQLKLGSTAPFDAFGASFERLAPDGALPVIGPGSTLEIRAAADRARVFLAYTQYDLDGDGGVTREEFDTHAALSWGDTLGEREYAILDAEWAAGDANGDGVITHSEILGLALSMHPVPETGPLGEEGEAMLNMDLDNDGFVIWDEVKAVLRSRMR